MSTLWIVFSISQLLLLYFGDRFAFGLWEKGKKHDMIQSGVGHNIGTTVLLCLRQTETKAAFLTFTDLGSTKKSFLMRMTFSFPTFISQCQKWPNFATCNLRPKVVRKKAFGLAYFQVSPISQSFSKKP